jgi:hypothetical protein
LGSGRKAATHHARSSVLVFLLRGLAVMVDSGKHTYW